MSGIAQERRLTKVWLYRTLATGAAIAALALPGVAAADDGPKNNGNRNQTQAAQTETRTISVKSSTLTDHDCDANEWHFIINQLRGVTAPKTISVSFDGAAAVDVEVEKVTPGGVAHYTYLGHLDKTVTGATAVILGAWGGNFNLSHGPCPSGVAGVVDTNTDTNTGGTAGDSGTNTGGSGGTGDTGSQPPALVPVLAKSLTGYECVPGEWHFVINQVNWTEQNAPKITVTFEGVSDALTLSVDKVSGGVAHYVTKEHLTSKVLSAVVNVADPGQIGQFNLSHGPCPTGTLGTVDTNTGSNTGGDTGSVVTPPVVTLPTDGTAVNPGSLTQYPCIPGELHFVINQVNWTVESAPKIYVQFSDGTVKEVSATKVTDGTAHYFITDPALLKLPVANAVAGFTDQTWKGQFNLSHGPCF